MRQIPALFIGSLALAGGDVVLRWTPKVDDMATYAVEGTIKARGMKLKLGGTDADRITQVDEKAVVTVSETDEIVRLPFGIRRKTGRSPETTTKAPDGTVLDVRGPDGKPSESSFRYARLGMLVLPEKPVAVGGTWSVERPKDANASMTGVRLNYTLLGDERIGTWDAWKIAVKGGETGDSKTTVEATFWIEKATGARVRDHSTITDAEFPGDGGRVDSETDSVRQPDPPAFKDLLAIDPDANSDPRRTSSHR